MVDNNNDDVLNEKLQFEYENQFKYENWIENLDGIQQKDIEWVMKRYTVDNDNSVHRKLINSNTDNGNENNDTIFHDTTQVENVIDDNDDDDSNN